LLGEDVRRREMEHLELQHTTERWPATLRAIALLERFVENRPEQRHIDDLEQRLDRGARRRQLRQTIADTPEPGSPRQRLHRRAPEATSVDHRPGLHP